jgi:hypothetical protein
MKQVLSDVAFFAALAGVTYKLLDLTTRDETITEIKMDDGENVPVPNKKGSVCLAVATLSK